MENPKPKKPLLEDYRDNLANDLREIRNVESRDHAQEILAEEKQTQRYEMAEAVHADKREDVQSSFIDKSRESEGQKHEMTESFYKIERERVEGKIEELNNNFYEKLGEPIIFNPSTDQNYQNWLTQENKKNNKGSIFEYVRQTFSSKHYLPDKKYENYLYKNQEKIPESFKDGNTYYFPGDFPDLLYIRSVQPEEQDGYLNFGRNQSENISSNSWDSRERVILF